MKIINLIPLGLKWKGAGIILAAGMAAFLASWWPVLLSGLYEVAAAHHFDRVWVQLCVCFLVFVLAEIILILCRVASDRIIAQFEQHMRILSIEKVLTLPSSFLAGEVSGRLTSRINQAVSGASALVSIIVKDLVGALLIGSFLIGQALFNAPPIIAAMMFGYIICAIGISLLQIRSQKGIREQIIRQKTDLDGELCQSIQYAEHIRFMNAERCEINRLSPQINEIKHSEITHHTQMGIYDSIKQAIKGCFFAGLVGTCMWLIMTNQINSGMLITITLLFQQLIKPIDEIYRFMDECSASKIKARILIDILEQPHDPVFDIPDSVANFTQEELHISSITVHNPRDERQILSQESDIRIKTNYITGVTGPSGAGKSSICKGLLRFYPSKGSITVFGVPLENISQKQLASLVYYLPQNPFFFAGTLRENLIYGLHRQPTDTELLEALKKSLIYEELLAKGNDVLSLTIEEGGKNFSAGQRQRLAITRAFLASPKLYILDESTANVDSVITAQILDNLELYAFGLHAGILYISHDDKVQAHCKKLISISQNGQQAESVELCSIPQKGCMHYEEKH